MSKKERSLFYIAVIFISLAVFSRVILYPAMEKSRTLNHQIQLKRQMIENSLRLLSQKEEIEANSRKYAKYYAKRMLSEENETASFLKEIEDIARISQVQLIDLKPYSARRIDFYTEHKVELETESDMNQLIAFLYNLQSSDSLLRVVKFRISPKPDRSDILKTNLTITEVLIP